MKTMKNNIGRYIILVLFVFVAAVMIVSKLIGLQLLDSEDFGKVSVSNGLTETRVISAERGTIFDRSGVVLAGTDAVYNVYMSVRAGSDNAKLNGIVEFLMNIYEENGEHITYSFNRYIKYPSYEYGYALADKANVVAYFRNFTGLKLENLEEGCSAKELYDAIIRDLEINEEYDEEKKYVVVALRFELLWGTNGRSVCIGEGIDEKTAAIITENSYELPGVTVKTAASRKYFCGEDTAHVLGYIAKISADEYTELTEQGLKYDADDSIGKSGIEKSYEQYLKGYDGEQTVSLNSEGAEIAYTEKIAAERGSDVYLTLDLDVQQAAMKSLAENIAKIAAGKDGSTNHGDASAGAAVALEVNTGKVLALASYPTFDTSIFLAPAEDKKAQDAITALFAEDSGSPTYNRAIQGLYAPGSTFKPLVAIAAMEEKIVYADTLIEDKGTWIIDGTMVYCMEYRDYGYSHNWLNVVTALETSCNMYFYKVGIQTGIDNIDKWAKRFGLGEKTGIDISGELGGTRNNRETKLGATGEIWVPLNTAQASIGQLYNAFSPIQLANYIAAVANGGTLITPYLVDKVVTQDGEIEYKGTTTGKATGVSEYTINTVREGMVAVTNATDGTAWEIFNDFPVDVAGKTGTPETGREEEYGESSNAVFVCYAPADNPQIAVAVVIEHGVWGANAAPVARDILSSYFGY